ncbi:MAG: bacteriohemerythrin [Gammaproteobacteria bacterium]|nr:bacteriohemerythrin [Gammaproteobacteria bacterium]MDH5801136.1 bacteriohemerythrin [Gammaproteobacteria bacterium]
MEKINWDKSYSVNVDMLDTQHQNLFAIINKFYDVVQAKKDTSTLSTVFKQVLDYTQTHFKIEEHYLKKYGYPDIEKHMLLHSTLVDRAQTLYSDINAGKSGAAENAIGFLKDWLEGHIKGVDTKYSSHLNQHGMH